MTDAIDLTTEQRKTLKDLLRRFLPGAAVWAYGSRVKWTARPNSDLDLVAFTVPKQRAQVADLKDALAESNLPFLVDLHVWDDVPERFREIIRKDYAVVQDAKEPRSKKGLADEWKQTTLGAIATQDGYGLVDGPFGSNLPASCYTDSGVPVIRGSNLSIGTSRFVTDEFVFVSRKTADHLARSICRPNDVVFTKKGTLGQTGLVPERGPYDEYLLSSNQMKLTVDRKLADPLFVYYYVSSPESIDKIIRDSAVTGVPKTNVAYLRDFQIALPPLSEQRAIAHILGTLDDKIELNRRMNETLEAMARALFKSWFVNFDPVRARAEGRDIGLPEPVADLFPGSFEDSELGEIPRGWRVSNWGALVTLEYGKSLRQYDGSRMAYPVYGTNGPIGSHSEPLCAHAGIIIGRKGAYRGVHFCSTPFFVIDTAFYVEPKEPIELRWAYYELLRQDINSMDSGSAIPSTSREDFYNVRVLSPPLRVQETFAEMLKPCWAKQGHNNRESSSLAALRDTLLPKLISGELRVKDAERFVERGCEPVRNHDSSMV